MCKYIQKMMITKTLRNQICILFGLMVLSLPVNSYAQCLFATDNMTKTTQSTAISAKISTGAAALSALVTSLSASTSEAIELALIKYEYAFIDRIKFLATQVIEDGLKPLAVQIGTSKLGGNLQAAKFEDAAAAQENTMQKQLGQYRSTMNYKPSPQDYRFDSKARFLRLGEKVGITSSSSFAQVFAKIGSNRTGGDSELAGISLENKRWLEYQKFCDPLSNGGNSGCEKESADDKSNLHIMPSKSIFAKDTIDFVNEPHMLEALKELSFNITGYDVSPSMSKGTVTSVAGVEGLLRNRTYVARMDAVSSMLYSIMADRFPISKEEVSGSNPVQDTRTALGAAFPSATPSFYETHKSFIEELWTPGYYMDLLDNSYTIERKEIYLQAYGLMMLSKIIEKQEKISNAYAIETAAMLSKDAVMLSKGVSGLSTESSGSQ